MNVGRTVFFDIDSGDILVDTLEKTKGASYRDPNYYISRYKVLSERLRNTFSFIELEYGQYAQDFTESDSYRVNPETKELEFSYPDPNEPDEPITYQAPLSEQVEYLKHENQLLKAQNNATSERADFIEDIIAEMAMQVYQ